MKKEVGIVIRAIRKTCGLTQEYMACRLQITVHTYANMENGRCDLSIGKLNIIASMILIKPSQILGLAEAVVVDGENNWLPSIIKGMLRPNGRLPESIKILLFTSEELMETKYEFFK